ncbi:MAG TPA: very short patch repair endonuclease [Bryobacteraceae bacterium]|nr:very short patch repair endonuclease [Bryobacteraceae bacterium]
MVDRLTPERRSENMRRIKSENMKPEVIVRQVVHRLGHRFRLHRKDLPGTPDLVFGPKRKVIFVHGCFWHGHESKSCLDGRIPKSNLDYWGPKLARNKQRDAECSASLRAEGWDVLTVWECEIKDTRTLESKITSFLSSYHKHR